MDVVHACTVYEQNSRARQGNECEAFNNNNQQQQMNIKKECDIQHLNEEGPSF